MRKFIVYTTTGIHKYKIHEPRPSHHTAEFHQLLTQRPTGA